MGSSNYTILVVDDEELIRRLIVTFLSQLGHLCITATDGVDALEKMDGNKMDAVIADIKMPKMDGIILTKEISTKYPGLPVMVMTAFDEEYSAGVAISVGAREFIKKPFSLDEFAIRFHKMIGDSETLKRMKSGKDVDEDIQKPRNELETLKRMKSKVESDEEILEFIHEIETLSRMKRGKEADGDLEEFKDGLEKSLKKN
jgi:DNA-binding response OmpR family regulator